MGREIAEQRNGENIQLLVVENDSDRIEEAQQRGFTVLRGTRPRTKPWRKPASTAAGRWWPLCRAMLRIST